MNDIITLRLLAALAAGLIIGFEREWQKKPAGLRTNAVSTGSHGRHSMVQCSNRLFRGGQVTLPKHLLVQH